MNENLGTVENIEHAELGELEMQELEALEAPGFWTGVSVGTAISASVATSITLT
ncbi:daptide-type RiPP [Streptomyces sp. NPDC002130]|uniref:daptide-type RiPP n=1 Tax=Streptomyces sp. NPDC002130 TaxID=3155568 RepID=UPI003324E2AD